MTHGKSQTTKYVSLASLTVPNSPELISLAVRNSLERSSFSGELDGAQRKATLTQCFRSDLYGDEVQSAGEDQRAPVSDDR